MTAMLIIRENRTTGTTKTVADVGSDSPLDLRLLEPSVARAFDFDSQEDAEDVADAMLAIAEDRWIPWDEIKARYGL